MDAQQRLKYVPFMFFAFLILSMIQPWSAFAQENAEPESGAREKGYSLETDIAQYPFKPPDTSSPRSTVKDFIDNMNRSYRILMEAHRENTKAPGFFTPESVSKIAQRADELIIRSIYCLDLSKVEEDLREKVGYESALMLKEILDRIEIPPIDEIPGSIVGENEGKEDSEVSRWRIPNTGIIIERVKDGPREGEYLFAPETISRLESFYKRAKYIPYKSDTFVSRYFYDFYISTPGQLLPPKWNKWIPVWSTEIYFGQTIWQWGALVIFPLFVLSVSWLLARIWHKKSAELSLAIKLKGWALIFLSTALIVTLIEYALKEHINITGGMLVFVENYMQKLVLLLLLGLVLWENLKTTLQHETLEEEHESEEDEEWGARSLSRSETMLLLVRKFLLIIIFIFVGFLFLSAIGINIGPLLAGAGVIGIAIGFGAQKLIADVLSGIFYLVDDAFRVGEYIETGSASGTVEAITLRNVMLRHHRGMLQFVPYSELGSVTNFMRGGIIVKFDLQLPYDTDIEKVRKIIKKVGKKMMKDPELGSDFIRPVKSQGVRSVGDSVMTFRVKFTSQPGKHFVIRREAFRRITEALEAKGIYYAHRKVIVELPSSDQQRAPSSTETAAKTKQSEKQQPNDDQILAGAAAGLETIVNKDVKKTTPDKME